MKNEIKIIVQRLLRNRNNEIVLSRINAGSGIPNNEFIIILGSNTNNAAPITANCFLTNLAHKRYTGIIVKTEIIIDKNRCKYVNSKNFCGSKIEKKNERNIDQPLFDKSQFIGKCPC